MESSLANTNWITIAASLLSGGAAGSIITVIVNAVKSRKQTITYRTEVVPLFNRGLFTDSDMVATLTLSSVVKGGYAQDIPNLSVANIELINRGNKDYQDFKIGFTLSEGDWALHCVVTTIDRHHQAQIATLFGPGAPTREIDFVLSPFNRQDEYKFTAYVVARNGAEKPGDIKLSSSEPVIFYQAPTTTEVLVQAAKVVLEAGPLKVSIR